MFWEFLRIGLGVLRAHKFRSALTVLSITIGAFSVVVMSSLAKSGIATIARGIEDVGGARMVIFFPKPPERAERKRSSYFRGLTAEDAEALRGQVPGRASVRDAQRAGRARRAPQEQRAQVSRPPGCQRGFSRDLLHEARRRPEPRPGRHRGATPGCRARSRRGPDPVSVRRKRPGPGGPGRGGELPGDWA